MSTPKKFNYPLMYRLDPDHWTVSPLEKEGHEKHASPDQKYSMEYTVEVSPDHTYSMEYTVEKPVENEGKASVSPGVKPRRSGRKSSIPKRYTPYNY